MAYFPFYIDIKDRKLLIAGGGPVAYRKVLVIKEFDANIVIIAPEICEDIIAIQKECKNRIIIKEREFSDDDIDSADFVIAATGNSDVNSLISELCMKRSKLVNVVDDKEKCGFIFPAIIKQDDLVISISTGGDSPLMSAKIKNEIAGALPEYYGKLIKILGDHRDYIKNEIDSPEARKQIYDEIISFARKTGGNITPEDIDKIIRKY